MGILYALVLALSVKQDQAALHAGCEQDSTVVVSLPAGTPLELRYRTTGENGPCYKVKASLGTRVVEGYLATDAMDGLVTFERGRKRAESVSLAQLMESSRPPAQTGTSGPMRVWFGPGVSRAVVAQASASIDTNEPRKALDVLEPEIRKRPDAGLLAMAGYAAWKADEGRRALELWRQSMALAPNQALQGFYSQVERELASDQSNAKLEGANVVLRFEDGTIPKETAQQMLAAVDSAYLKVSSELGCKAQEKIVTIVQSRESYVRTTNVAAWNAGLYDGRIRVPMYDEYMGEEEERVLVHETTHACLSIMGHWPTWFQEGMAQRFSGEKSFPLTVAKLVAMGRERKLPSLNALSGDWSRLGNDQAAMAYSLALHAVNRLYDYYGADGVWILVHNPSQMPAIVAELDKILINN